MVILHPADASSKHISEQEIIDALNSIEGNDHIHVLFSLNIHHSSNRIEGEVDFLALIPGKGIVVIEAKAPEGVELKDRRMILKGVPDEKKDPFEQVDQARQEVMGFLGKRVGLYPTARAVWLTSIDASQLRQFDGGIGILPFELRSRNDLKNPLATLHEIIDGYNLENDGKEIHRPKELFTEDEVQRAIDFLQNDFSADAKREDLYEMRQAELQRLEEEQLSDLEGFRRNKHIYLYGAAGTGKSFMLTQIAIRAYEKDQRVLLTCWNRMMAEDLSNRWQAAYPEMVITDLGSLMAEIAGVDLKSGKGDSWYLDQLPKLALAALEKDPEGYDFDLIAVDEYQDIAAYPIFLQFLEKLGKGQSWSRTRVVLAGDKYQQILGTGKFEDNPLSLAEEVIQDFSVQKLTKNFRNAKGIVRVLEKLTDKKTTYTKTLVTSAKGEIEVIEVDNKTSPRRLRDAIVSLQSKYFNHQIRVISLERTDFSMPNFILKLPDDALRPEIAELKNLLKNSDTGTGVIPWRSIYRFKGLESDVVVITDVTQALWETLTSDGKSMLMLLYAAISRAHYKVVILCDHFVAEKLRALDL